jgi:hypothetical protein
MWDHRVRQRAFERLEPDEWKHSCPVLRGGGIGNNASLPDTIAIVPQQGEARLGTFCAALAPKIATKRRLQRKLDRQRRANNPQNYDEQGRCKKGRKTWHDSQGYQSTRRRVAHQERKLAAQRKSLHGQLPKFRPKRWGVDLGHDET